MSLNDEKGGGYRFYSLGIVVKDKEEGSDLIEVTPIEDFSFELGALSASDRTKNSSVKDTAGVVKSASIEGGSVVEAKWVPLSNPNRDNSPDVYRSETVMLYKYADTQDYYWSTFYREPKLRGRERMRHSLSNKDPGGEAYSDDTSYWVEIDTRYKHLKIHTSDNDGEPTTYDLTIDTKNGTVLLEDKLGNKIFLESVPGHLEVTTENSVTVNTKRYVLNATESVEINTPQYTLNADVSEINGVTHTVNSHLVATEGYAMSGGTGGNTGKVTGNVEHEGNYDQQGNHNVTGNIDATGTIMDGGGNSNHHSH